MTRPSESAAVFLDFETALGQVCFAADGRTMLSFALSHGAAELLTGSPAATRFGVVAIGWEKTTVLRALEDVGVLGHFGEKRVLCWATASPAEFRLAASEVGTAPERCVYVSADRTRRSAAVEGGMHAVPHPALAEAVLDGDKVVYIRVRAPGSPPDTWHVLSNAGLDMVPLHMGGEDGGTLYAIASLTALQTLRDQGFEADPLNAVAEVATSDVYLLRPGAATTEEMQTFLAELCAGATALCQNSKQVITALSADRQIYEFHPPAAGHGHTVELTPNRALLDKSGALPPLPVADLDPTDVQQLCNGLTEELLRQHLLPWCGLGPLPNGPSGLRIESRHVLDPQNKMAALGIARELERILGQDFVCTPAVPFAGMTLLNVEGEIRGAELPNELIILGAHLDSIAIPYNGKAPGADDDASGIAAVLAAAEVLKAMSARKRPRRSIRLALFNVEEYGMSGSLCYAAALQAKEFKSEIRVVAMLQMDMIGYARTAYPPGRYEIHVPTCQELGNTKEPVIARARDLAQIVIDAGRRVSPDLDPQLYPLENCDDDPACLRSDHRQFIINHWPACLVAEDFFMDVCGGSDWGSEHPGYHKETDTVVCYRYAADIARAVAAAAWKLANG